MKAIISGLLFCLWITPVWAAKPVVRSQAVGSQTALNVAVHYLDGVFANASASLELVASTTEAKKVTGKE